MQAQSVRVGEWRNRRNFGIVSKLKGHKSVREIGREIGLSKSQVHRIGLNRGFLSPFGPLAKVVDPAVIVAYNREYAF